MPVYLSVTIIFNEEQVTVNMYHYTYISKYEKTHRNNHQPNITVLLKVCKYQLYNTQRQTNLGSSNMYSTLNIKYFLIKGTI